MNKTKKTEYKLGELFCGPGGLAYGALHAKIEKPEYRIVHAWANDCDPETCKTYVHNICDGDAKTVFCEDVRTLDFNKLSEIDAFAFGFPCNDFSIVGERKGFRGNYGPLYTYGIKVLEKFKPQWFLAENVGGLRSANDKVAFKKILRDLREAGYKLYPHYYKFEEFRVPQARHRIIIIGIRNDLPYEFRPPKPTYINYDNSCKFALETPTIPDNALNNEMPKHSAIVVERLKSIKPGENVWNATLSEELKLHVKSTHLSQIYKRLDPKKPAYTITGSGGGGTHVYHWEENRALTNRERARLQTFPDTYEFFGSKEQVRKQIGMAVPCRAAEEIFIAVLNTFAEIKYDSEPCNIIIDENIV